MIRKSDVNFYRNEAMKAVVDGLQNVQPNEIPELVETTLSGTPRPPFALVVNMNALLIAFALKESGFDDNKITEYLEKNYF